MGKGSNTHKEKLVVYQIFIRLFGAKKSKVVLNGSKSENACGTFDSLNDLTLESITEMGFTHIWLTGIIQHASQTAYPKLGLKACHPAIVKGKAGSPYAITDFFELDPDLAKNPKNRWKEFEDCIQRIHNHGLKLIIDFVPNHTARIYKSEHAKNIGLRDLGQNDFSHEYFHPNNHYYYIPDQSLEIPDNEPDEEGSLYLEFPAKATGNDCFSSKPGKFDWYETVKLNYGFNYHNHQSYFEPIPATWKYMLEVLKFWSDKNIDGFRCDMVEMVPVEFWEWVIPQIKLSHKDVIFIAEVYNPEKYNNYLFKGKFDFLYDKVGLYDVLRALVEGKGNANEISKVWQNQEGFGERMLRFLENHDEQRIASDFIGGDPEKAIPAMAISTFLGKGPVMVYFGQELGEKAEGPAGFSGDDGKTTIFDYWQVPSIQKWIDQDLDKSQIELKNDYQKILCFAQNKAITQGSFFDIQYANQSKENYQSNGTYCFLRYVREDKYLFVNTFDVDLSSTRVVVPYEAWHNMGVDLEGRCQLQDPFEVQAPIDFYVKTSFWSEGNSAGILIPVQKFSYQIWKIEVL